MNDKLTRIIELRLPDKIPLGYVTAYPDGSATVWALYELPREIIGLLYAENAQFMREIAGLDEFVSKFVKSAMTKRVVLL